MTRPLAAAALLAACCAAQAQPAPLRTFTSPNPEPGGQFGYALAVLGDLDGDAVPDLLVGAPEEQASEDPFRVQGRAHVLSGATGDPLYTLVSPNEQPQLVGYRGDFGAAVVALGDLDGDGTGDVAVGAPGDSPEEEEGVGAAYVFSGATGTLLHTLAHPDALYQAGFGAALARLGDVDGDSVDDVGVGAFESGTRLTCESDFATSGMAYVFSGATGELLYEVAPTSGCETYFGVSIAGVGDVDGDERSDFAVGSLGDLEGDAPQLAGRVHVYSGATGDELYTLDSPNAQEQGRFGAEGSLVGIGDVDGDGVRDLAVGAIQEVYDAGAPTDGGHAYAFSGATGALLYTLEAPEPDPASPFGRLGPAGDLDGDGVGDLLAWDSGIGSNPDLPGDGSGSAYAFSGATGALLFSLTSPQPRSEAFFGWALDATADFTGDGRPDVVASEPGSFFSEGSRPGQVYLFSPFGVDTEPVPTASTDRALRLAPNPASDVARVTWGAAPARLAAFDVLGREVVALEATNGEATLDVAGWAPGLYVLRLETADGVRVQRFTVAR